MTPPFAKGERIRVLKDNGKTGLIDYVGVVDSVTQTGVIVILENDPLLRFRMNQAGGFERARPPIRRFFNLNEIEKIRGN